MNRRNVFVAIGGVLLALSYIACTIYLFLTAQQDKIWGLIIAELAIASIFHIIALVKVKKGTLTVYRNWADFGISCSWPISILLSILVAGAMLMCESNAGKLTCQILMVIFAIVAIGGLIWMIIGAFNNNKGKLFNSLIALYARATATLFFLTYVSKLLELKDKYEDNNVIMQDYVKAAIGFILFGIWFKMLVVPLVKDNRDVDRDDAVGEEG